MIPSRNGHRVITLPFLGPCRVGAVLRVGGNDEEQGTVSFLRDACMG